MDMGAWNRRFSMWYTRALVNGQFRVGMAWQMAQGICLHFAVAWVASAMVAVALRWSYYPYLEAAFGPAKTREVD